MEERLKELVAEGPIVFYDGECGLCDKFVQALIRVDKRKVLRYATLQGKTASEVLGQPEDSPDAWSVQLLDEAGLHVRSTAALRAIAVTGGLRKAFLAFLIVPKFLRDAVYRIVAKSRYSIFGKVDACVIPTPALRERFLP